MTLLRLDHVLVLTDDVEATVAFYRDALGLEPGLARRCPSPAPGSTSTAACLHVADRAAYEAHAASFGLEPAGESVDHVAFRADDYEEIAERLAAAGPRRVTNNVPEAGMRQLFVSDPNGVRIELNVAD